MTTWNTAGENTEALGLKLQEEFLAQCNANGVIPILLQAGVMSPAREEQLAEVWGSLARVLDKALTVTNEQKLAQGAVEPPVLPA